MKSLLFVSLILVCAAVITQCSKRDNAFTSQPRTSGDRLSYGDSIFYLSQSGENYTRSPLVTGQGKYTAVPNNLKIDENTGQITIAAEGLNNTSETGLWYKIFFESATTGVRDSTMIMISGINYVDAFYQFNKDGNGDTIISPMYNGAESQRMPKGRFWIKDAKFASIIDPANGNINISKFFKAVRTARQADKDSAWEELTINYQLEDKSYNADNHINILLYHYYISVDSVPSNVTAAMNAHRLQTFGVNLPLLTMTRGAEESLPSTLFVSGRSLKPRPPCVVIVGL